VTVTYVKASNADDAHEGYSSTDLSMSATGLLADDVGILCAVCDATSTIPTPTDWTFLATGLSSAGGQKDKARVSIFYRIATGTSLSCTMAWNDADYVQLYARFYVYRGVDTAATAFGYKNESDYLGANSTSHNLPAVTTTVDGTMVSFLFGSGTSQISTNLSIADLSGAVIEQNSSISRTGGDSDASLTLFNGTDTTAGSVAAGSFTTSNSSEHAIHAVHLPPFVVGEHTLNADDLQSPSQLSKPAATDVAPQVRANVSWAQLRSEFAGTEDDVLADDLESASEVSTPDVGQEHALLADDLESTSEVSSVIVYENLNRLLPDADTSIGSWETHTGSTSNLYQQIDEPGANDADFIRSEVAPSASISKFKLSNGSPTPVAGDDITVRYRYGKDDNDGVPMSITVRVIEGASTVIASWTHTDVPVTVTAANQILTGPQKTSITDYDDLYIEFEVTI